jgi:hypothetical protein
MGHFSNSAEGVIYVEQYCENCVHYKLDNDTQTEGCPVMDAHILYGYSQKDAAERILDMLIPRKGAYNGDCSMFICKLSTPDIPGQTKLF